MGVLTSSRRLCIIWECRGNMHRSCLKLLILTKMDFSTVRNSLPGSFQVIRMPLWLFRESLATELDSFLHLNFVLHSVLLAKIACPLLLRDDCSMYSFNVWRSHMLQN